MQDEFEKNLEEKAKLLKQCQERHSLNSCYNCEELFKCTTKKAYVDAVYSSMSKGQQSGGFDF